MTLCPAVRLWAVAVVIVATFVARAFSGDIPQAKEIVKAAIEHKGYALVDVFQPCVVFNKQNTFQWFKDHTYYLGSEHDKNDKTKALGLALDTGRLALGILYQETGRPSYETIVRDGTDPLHGRTLDKKKLDLLFKQYQ